MEAIKEITVEEIRVNLYTIIGFRSDYQKEKIEIRKFLI